MPEITAPNTVQEYMEPEGPFEIPGVCKSSKVKFQKKQDYILIMIGSKYAFGVSLLEYCRALYPDSHMLLMQT